jgi:hypothetical protein
MSDGIPHGDGFAILIGFFVALSIVLGLGQRLYARMRKAKVPKLK